MKFKEFLSRILEREFTLSQDQELGEIIIENYDYDSSSILIDEEQISINEQEKINDFLRSIDVEMRVNRARYLTSDKTFTNNKVDFYLDVDSHSLIINGTRVTVCHPGEWVNDLIENLSDHPSRILHVLEKEKEIDDKDDYIIVFDYYYSHVVYSMYQVVKELEDKYERKNTSEIHYYKAILYNLKTKKAEKSEKEVLIKKVTSFYQGSRDHEAKVIE